MSLLTLDAKIKEKLDGLKGAGKPFEFVYRGHRSIVEGYPCVSYQVKRKTDEFLDNADNIRTFTYQVIILQEIESLGVEGAYERLLNCVEQVLNTFDDDYTLGGEALVVKSTPFDMDFITSPNGEVLFADVRLSIDTFYNLT
jgi:hypothetical protein